MSASASDRPPREPLVAPGEADLHTRDMTATFSGELTLDGAQKLLAPSNQWIPIDGDPKQTLAGLVETDSTGPLRLGYGAWRDLLLGVQFTNGRGELISAGGKTVKNVAGYDLTKLMVGQAGILGRIVSITTRTYLRPPFTLLVRAAPKAEIISRLIPTPCRPQWAMLTDKNLLLGYMGDGSTIDYLRTHLPDGVVGEIAERPFDEDRADRARLWRATGEVTFRASVPPASLADFVRDFADPARVQSWVADPAFGIVLGSAASNDARAEIARSAAAVGGSMRSLASTADAPVQMAATEAERTILGRLKAAFDPTEQLPPLPWRRAQ